ncbi:hypothetical protein QBC35DRAFT_35466 [Podospora australis]|uniref:Zn(2)-C6 fungal-type domain-containing protein n=1 Tax=Podospora australis TaxID=1536484 RepID=A0AAN6WZI8_9PEZI|nr:hypothetical protein QBC35DRAFT_35466 [Podospora australis]
MPMPRGEFNHKTGRFFADESPELPDASAAPPSGNRKASKKLPCCEKCHSLKMRCIRPVGEERCNRCTHLRIECVQRPYARVGRPPLGEKSTTRSTPNPKPPRGGPAPSSKKAAPPGNHTLSQDIITPLQPRFHIVSSVQSDSNEAPRYAGPLIGTGACTALLPNFDHMPDDASSSEATLTPKPSDELLLQDPVGRLTKLHLDLYQCLNAAKSVEIAKNNKETSSSSCNTNWIRSLFHAADGFIKILVALGGSAAEPSAYAEDTATFLIMISCYTRLLQIFDVFVSLMQTVVCDTWVGDLVQVNVAGFLMPLEDRAMQKRFVVQCIQHVIEKVQQAVGGVVSLSGEKNTDAALEGAKGLELRIREGVWKILHAGRR